MIKLTYFAARGRVEPTRLLLELTKTPYTYEPVEVDVWRAGGKQKMLERTPFGQMPILEDGELVLSQSQAIFRYLARKLELLGSTPGEQARVDEVCETALDLAFDFAQFNWEKAYAEKRPAHRQATATKLERLQNYFERVSPDGKHWVLNGRYTAADVAMAAALEASMPIHPGLLETYPKLHAAMERFFAEPSVWAYVTSERRQRTATVPVAPFGGKPEETHQFTA